MCWKKGFPEYGKDYGKVLEAIEKLEKDLPGLYYAGTIKDLLKFVKNWIS